MPGRIASVVLCLVACACEHDPGSSPRPAPEPACFADSLPPLRIHWEDRPDCSAENVDCRESCAAGEANACFARALTLERSPATAKEALELFRRACQLGHANACTNMAATEWDPDSETSDVCLYRVFERTCEVGDPFGCGMAGRLLVDGQSGLIYLAHGRVELELACARLGGFPCRIVAAYIERGVFGSDERARIPALMARACSGGDDAACGNHATVDETFITD